MSPHSFRPLPPTMGTFIFRLIVGPIFSPTAHNANWNRGVCSSDGKKIVSNYTTYIYIYICTTPLGLVSNNYLCQ